MATLYKHGAELARRETPYGRIAVMSDGNILRNQGQGWKLYKRTKPGVDPREYARKFSERSAAIPVEVRTYIEALRDAVDLEHRWMLHEAIVMMPEDADGVWSSLDDYGYGADLDDIVKACRLYLVAKSSLEVAA